MRKVYLKIMRQFYFVILESTLVNIYFMAVYVPLCLSCIEVRMQLVCAHFGSRGECKFVLPLLPRLLPASVEAENVASSLESRTLNHHSRERAAQNHPIRIKASAQRSGRGTELKKYTVRFFYSNQVVSFGKTLFYLEEIYL